VTVTVERSGIARRLSLSLVRGEIHRRAVRRTALLANGVGYVDVDVFSDSTETELTHAIDSLKAVGLTSFILDLRANPGGLLAQGVAVADLFLNAGQTVVAIHGRTPETNRTYADSAAERWPSLPMAVLVDEATASASEIVAGALQDHDRAVIIGQTSLGKGSAQSVFPTITGGGVKLTTARWYTPLGRSITRVRDTTTVLDTDADVPRQQRFKTPLGRTVYGGGGITPDIVVGDSALTPEEGRLQNVLGDRVTQFRDALTAYAVSLKERGTLRDPNFEVTDAMFDAAWRSVQRRGFTFDRRIFDDARPLIDQLLVREITRTVFGPNAEVARSIRDDEAIQRAAQVLKGASSPTELLLRISKGTSGAAKQ
jgi:carboxyl-terminal processing protease